MHGCVFRKLAFLLPAILLSGWLTATGLCAENIQATPACEAQSESSSLISNTDFDGDNKPDLAVGSSNGPGYTIEIHLTARPSETYLTLAKSGLGTRILACDVDGDHHADLVVTSATSLLPIAIYRGDGRGHFREGNPWGYLPALLDTPYRWEPGQDGVLTVSLPPPSRFSCVLERNSGVRDGLEVVERNQFRSGTFPSQPSADCSTSRSPPLS